MGKGLLYKRVVYDADTHTITDIQQTKITQRFITNCVVREKGGSELSTRQRAGNIFYA